MHRSRPETLVCKAILACLALVGVPACAGPRVHVSPTQPHATAELIVAHSGQAKPGEVVDVAVLDGVRIDLGADEGPHSVRVAPGEHELVLTSANVVFRNQVVRREVPQYCSLPNCAFNMPPLYEDSMELRPVEIPSCSRTMHIKVSAGETVRETLYVAADGKCAPTSI